MPYYYNPYALSNYTPVFTPMPVPLISSATEAPLVCVQMSAALVPYLVGLLEIYRWKDRFIGTESQVTTALGVIQDLVVLLTEGNCPECLENPMPASFRFTETCGLEYTNDNGTTWYNVPGWSTYAELCFKGPQGDQGPQGEPGVDGVCVDCEDGVVTIPEPSPEQIPPGQDARCLSAASMEQIIYDTMKKNHDETLLGASATGVLSALFTLLAFVFPPAAFAAAGTAFAAAGGAFVTAGGMSLITAGVRSELLCLLYCYIGPDGRFATDEFSGLMNELNTKATSPINAAWEFIKNTVYALNIEMLNNAARLLVVSDADCSACECEGQESSIYEWDFALSDGGFILEDITTTISGDQFMGVWTSGVGWEDSYEPQRGARGIRIRKDFNAAVAGIIKFEFEVRATAGAQNSQYSLIMTTNTIGHDFTPSWSANVQTLTHVINPSQSISWLRLQTTCSLDNTVPREDFGGDALYLKVRMYSNQIIPAASVSGGRFI